MQNQEFGVMCLALSPCLIPIVIGLGIIFWLGKSLAEKCPKCGTTSVEKKEKQLVNKEIIEKGYKKIWRTDPVSGEKYESIKRHSPDLVRYTYKIHYQCHRSGCNHKWHNVKTEETRENTT